LTFDDAYTTIARWNASDAVIGNTAILSMGETEGPNPSINSHTWIYQMNRLGEGGDRADVWTEGTPFEGPITTGAVSFSLTSTAGGGGFFLIPGTPSWKPGTNYAELWQFYPNRPPNPNDN
jgi:hypothetical protein